MPSGAADVRSETSPSVLTNVLTACNDSHMNTETATNFGITVHGNEFSNSTRGIAQHDGIFTAITQAHSRDFKTLNGAVAFMARYGYDAQGRRL